LIEEYSFNTVKELFDYLAPWNTNLEQFIFRGHSKESFELVPSALRLDNQNNFWNQVNGGRLEPTQIDWSSHQIWGEYHLLREFYRLADMQGLEVPASELFRSSLAQRYDLQIQRMQGRNEWIPNDLLEATALAQHYGVPTRLLDWSYDRFVATYFALHGALGSTEGKVVIWALNRENVTRSQMTAHPICIKFVTPHYSGNPNISAQKGLFTYVPVTDLSQGEKMNLYQQGQYIPIDRTPLDQVIRNQVSADDNTKYLIKLSLPATEAEKGMSILTSMGYGSSRVFPGYGGVAKQILEQNKFS